MTGVAFLKRGSGADAATPRQIASACKAGTLCVWDGDAGMRTAQSSCIGDGVTGLAAARADETERDVRLYASCAEGQVHAIGLEPGSNTLSVVATGKQDE